ncbi:uncharacterized protein LOC142608723 [Castanea sativa]|uniref:uncharacterized protein LOC142608723 n=1 Tax=Castanea sativa TaxID=21020 RepID=UPI003F651EEC
MTFANKYMDQTVASLQQCEKICTGVFKEPEKDEQDPSKTDSKDEQDSELPKPTPNRTTSYASFGFRKSRRNLTEAEKEERRIRRVLANRESARQTIRRRQALCEELTRKSAGLQWENENLKREKELALKKYQSLETTNKLLKVQMVKAIKVEVGETPPEHKPADVATSTSSSSNCPLFLFTRPPLMPVFWPSIIPSQNPVPSLHGRLSATVIPSNIDMPEKKQESAIYPNKKLTNAVAASKARKRRKELTKLKNLNGRQCRMHC